MRALGTLPSRAMRVWAWTGRVVIGGVVEEEFERLSIEVRAIFSEMSTSSVEKSQIFRPYLVKG